MQEDPKINQEIKPEWVNADNPPTPENPNIPFAPQVHEIHVKKNNILLKIIMSLVLISVGVFGVLAYQKYFANKPVVTTFTPTPISITDQTADWKTFDSQLGYSLKYPEKIKTFPITNMSAETVSSENFPDVVFSSESGMTKPHLRITRLTKEYVVNANQTLLQAATNHYQSNLQMPAVPATSVQTPVETTFAGLSAVSFSIKNNAFKSLGDEYLGFDGVYHVVWLDNDKYRYIIYWTEDQIINEIVSTFSFTNNVSTADWKTYTSKQEKISFKYPSTWKVVTPTIGSTSPDGDALTIQSPNGKIKINWVSFVDGLGGACDTEIALGQTPTEGPGPCPLFTFISKAPINGATGLYVVSGTMTSDGKSYEPFMAVQDTNTGSLLSTRRTMGYDLYEGRNNSGVSVLFATSGIVGGGQTLSASEASAWFNDPEVQEAKQILLSLTY